MKEFLGRKMINRTIRIRVSDTCNQNCSYCKEHDLSKIKFITKENFQLLLDNIIKLFKYENRKINLFLYGGEPLLNKDLWNFLISCREPRYCDIIDSIEIHSNLNIKLEKYQLNILELMKVSMASSIHMEYKKNFDRIFKNFRLIQQNNINLNEINLMFHDLNDYNEIINIEKNNSDLPICIVPTFQLISKEYSKLKILLRKEMKQKTVPNNNGGINYIDIHKLFNPLNWNCNVPKDCFEIDSNGMVYWCHEDYMMKNPSGVNFFQTFDPEDFNKSIKCKYQNCDCEYYIYKEK